MYKQDLALDDHQSVVYSYNTDACINTYTCRIHIDAMNKDERRLL